MLKNKKVNTINGADAIFSFKADNCVLHNQTQIYTAIPKNVLFFPGIPGLSSEYLFSLAHILKLPTNVWRIDLPDNGGNPKHQFKDFDSWLNLFLETLEPFDRPILVSHSFGAMIPLMLPQTENLLSGIILLNSAPSLPKELKLGKEPLLDGYPFNEKPALWLHDKLVNTNFTAQWVPKNIPALILGGRKDTIIPFNLFKKDGRFQQNNITIKTVPNSGHFCWLDNPLFVRKTVYTFLSDLFEAEGF